MSDSRGASINCILSLDFVRFVIAIVSRRNAIGDTFKLIKKLNTILSAFKEKRAS